MEENRQGCLSRSIKLGLRTFEESFDSSNIWDVKMKWESNQKMMSAMEQRYKLTKAQCKDIFLRGFFMLFGIATMIAKSKIDMSNEEAIDMVKKTVSEMVAAEKG